jgi:hypothetical protein
MQETLSEKIATLIEQSRLYVAQVANTAMVQTYYKIGEMLVEELQNGATRAEYGVQLLQKVGRLLTKQFGKGFSETNLKQMRDFYTAYSIRQTVSDEWQWSSVLSYYDRYVKLEHENPTVGIIICKDKNQSLVEITLPKDNQQIFAQKYQTVLPSKEVLKALLEKYNE